MALAGSLRREDGDALKGEVVDAPTPNTAGLVESVSLGGVMGLPDAGEGDELSRRSGVCRCFWRSCSDGRRVIAGLDISQCIE